MFLLWGEKEKTRHVFPPATVVLLLIKGWCRSPLFSGLQSHMELIQGRTTEQKSPTLSALISTPWCLSPAPRPQCTYRFLMPGCNALKTACKPTDADICHHFAPAGFPQKQRLRGDPVQDSQG